VVASDGFELELEAVVNLNFTGSLVIPEDLCQSFGWRCLGARRVIVGIETKLMHHFIGLISVGQKSYSVVVLGGLNQTPYMGQKMLAGRKLTVDYQNGTVTLE